MNSVSGFDIVAVDLRMTHPETVIKNPSWWRRRSQMERGLVLMAGLTTALCIILIALLTYTAYKDENREPLPQMSALNSSEEIKAFRPTPKDPEICLKAGCIHTASELLHYIDPMTDPCDDFYQFACGNFRTKFIPDDKSSLSLFTAIGDRLEEQLRTIIGEPIKDDEILPIKYGKNMYAMCMNTTRIEEVGAEPVLDMLKTLGGWPVLEGEKWDMGSWSWKDTIYKFRKTGFGIDYFIDFGVGTDLKNSTQRLIELDQSLLGTNREYLIKGLSHKRVAAYYEYMVDIATLFGADPELAKKDMKESLELEIALANISLPIEERRDANKLYNKMTISELQSKFPTIPWREYITNIMPSTITITEDEPIVVAVPTFMEKLEHILEQTPKRTLANYLLWRAAASTVSYLPTKFRDRQLKYSTALTGNTQRPARWKECSDIASKSVSLAVGSLYVQRYFKEEAKKNALELVERIRKEMTKILKTVDWMDEKTRISALEKAETMTAHIAYPSELLDSEKITTFYKRLEIHNNGNYIEAVLNTTKFGHDFSFGRLRDPVNKTEWLSHGRPTIVNAFYNSLENSIQFPAGILQGNFFSNQRPNYMNYGAIGFVIGHEITHGFDDQGRQFDKDGNLVDWWAEETKKHYLKKAQCIIDQYGNYTDSQVLLNLNGINTQGENIADNGGIKQAYRAYLEWIKDNSEEPRLPGLQQYTPTQMFWISAATTWCSVYRNETLANRITTGYHSPGEFRVKGPISNMEDFSKDFNCPTGSPMNPVNKCTVW